MLQLQSLQGDHCIFFAGRTRLANDMVYGGKIVDMGPKSGPKENILMWHSFYILYSETFLVVLTPADL